MRLFHRLAWLLYLVLLVGSVATCASPVPAPSTGVNSTAAPPAAAQKRGVEAPAQPTPDATAQEEAFRSAPDVPRPSPTSLPATLPPATLPAPGALPEPSPASAARNAAVVPPTLQDELFLAGAPGRGAGGTCENFAIEELSTWWDGAWGYGTLCLYGFVAGEMVEYEVYDAAGELVDSGDVTPESQEGRPSSASIELRAKTYTPGEWQILARAPSNVLQSTFTVTEAQTAAYVELTLQPSPEVTADGRFLYSLVPGDVVELEADYLPPSAPIAIGIYYQLSVDADTQHLRQTDSAIMDSDENGQLKATITVESSDVPGFYCVVVTGVSDYEPSDVPEIKGGFACYEVVASGPELGEVVSTLADEIFLAGPPAFYIEYRCDIPASASDGAITWAPGLDAGMFCIFGFEENEIVRYEVYDAAGEMVTEGEGSPDNMDGDPLPSVKLLVNTTENAPGLWTVIARTGTAELTANAEVGPMTLDGEPAVVLVLKTESEPILVGGTVGIAAYNLPPEAEVLVGVYRVVEEDASGSTLQLHEGGTLASDEDGAAFGALTHDPSYEPGDYCVVIMAEAGYEPAHDLSARGATRCFQVAPE